MKTWMCRECQQLTQEADDGPGVTVCGHCNARDIVAVQDQAVSLLGPLLDMQSTLQRSAGGLAHTIQRLGTSLAKLQDLEQRDQEREAERRAVSLQEALDDYQARFVVLHDAWRSGDNARALDALRRHVTADDRAGKNAVLMERGRQRWRVRELRERNERLTAMVRAAYHLFQNAIPKVAGGPTSWHETRDRWCRSCIEDLGIVNADGTTPDAEEIVDPQPDDIRALDLIHRLLLLIQDLDPGWNSITTPDVVVEAAALVSDIPLQEPVKITQQDPDEPSCDNCMFHDIVEAMHSSLQDVLTEALDPETGNRLSTVNELARRDVHSLAEAITSLGRSAVKGLRALDPDDEALRSLQVSNDGRPDGKEVGDDPGPNVERVCRAGHHYVTAGGVAGKCWCGEPPQLSTVQVDEGPDPCAECDFADDVDDYRCRGCPVMLNQASADVDDESADDLGIDPDEDGMKK